MYIPTLVTKILHVLKFKYKESNLQDEPPCSNVTTLQTKISDTEILMPLVRSNSASLVSSLLPSLPPPPPLTVMIHLADCTLLVDVDV